MHELAITTNIVEIVGAAAQGRRVTKVTLAVGAQAGVATDAIAFCFDVVAKGTVADGAVLEIVERAGAELSIMTMEIEETT